MKLAALIAAVLLVWVFPSTIQVQADRPRAQAPEPITSHDVNEIQGWIIVAGRLLTADAGGGPWRDVTPESDSAWQLTGVDFAGRDGWAVGIHAANGSFGLWRTVDGGANWLASRLSLYSGDSPPPPVASAFIDIVDGRYGWLVTKHVTSANFSTGDLFATTDGGATWERRALPIGEPVHFTSRTTGKVWGGPTGEENYTTTDGGRSWRAGSSAVEEQAGIRWAGNPGEGRGWQVVNKGVCDDLLIPSTCRVMPQLLFTTDGGRSWKPGELPVVAGGPAAPQFGPQPEYEVNPEVVLDLQRAQTEIVQNHGFDKCEIATINQLVDWFYNSPYRSVNIYFGGSSRACSNKALTATYLQQVHSIGWSLIPTWVGRQAPCFAYSSKAKMSWDPEEAFIQGIEEANWASDRLAELELSDDVYFGSVAYYDIEYYDYRNAACHDAVRGFVTGWSAQMRARGNVAGVYSTGTILSGFANLAARPDVIWAANWLQPYYFRPDASVWNVYGLSNSLWVNHQRVRQYTGGHNETWGTTMLNIDSNVLDGVVARLGPALTPTLTPTPTVTPTPSITPTPWEVHDRHRLPLILR